MDDNHSMIGEPWKHFMGPWHCWPDMARGTVDDLPLVGWAGLHSAITEEKAQGGHASFPQGMKYTR